MMSVGKVGGEVRKQVKLPSSFSVLNTELSW